MTAHLDVQIWREDINEQEEMALDCWKVTYNFFERLRYHNASPDLVAKMGEASTHFSEAFNKLKEIRDAFPPQDGILID